MALWSDSITGLSLLNIMAPHLEELTVLLENVPESYSASTNEEILPHLKTVLVFMQNRMQLLERMAEGLEVPLSVVLGDRRHFDDE